MTDTKGRAAIPVSAPTPPPGKRRLRDVADRSRLEASHAQIYLSLIHI